MRTCLVLGLPSLANACVFARAHCFVGTIVAFAMENHNTTRQHAEPATVDLVPPVVREVS